MTEEQQGDDAVPNLYNERGAAYGDRRAPRKSLTRQRSAGCIGGESAKHEGEKSKSDRCSPGVQRSHGALEYRECAQPARANYDDNQDDREQRGTQHPSSSSDTRLTPLEPRRQDERGNRERQRGRAVAV